MRRVSRSVLGVVSVCLLLTGAFALAQSVADSYTPVTQDLLVDPPYFAAAWGRVSR